MSVVVLPVMFFYQDQVSYSTMDQRLMPDVLDIREVVFTNLLLLDFRPDVFEAKHHCPFTR